MIGYKLFRVRKDGTLGSLFINRKQILEVGKLYESSSHRTKGFAYRPGWHICAKPFAPHLSTKDRRWYMVYFSGDFEIHNRPLSQGGTWYTAKYMRILKPVEK